MIPKICHQAWFGPRPEEIRQMMLTVRRHHPDWEIKLWHEDNIKDLGLNFADLMDKCQNFASVSNVVRLHAIFQFGGIWIDSDCKVLKSFEPLRIYSAFAATQDGKRLCNAVMGAQQAHPWIISQIMRQDYLMNADAARAIYLMNDTPLHAMKELPTSYFYPWHYEDAPEKRHPKPESYCEHFWSGSWSKKI